MVRGKGKMNAEIYLVFQYDCHFIAIFADNFPIENERADINFNIANRCGVSCSFIMQ